MTSPFGHYSAPDISTQIEEVVHVCVCAVVDNQMMKPQTPMLQVIKAGVICHCLLAVATFCRANAVTEAQHDSATASPVNVLIFSKTQGFRHASIPLAVSSLKSLGVKRNWNVDATES